MSVRRRRRPPWDQVAEMARQAGGRWRLHPSLAVSDIHLLHHMQRRVRALRPTKEGHFEYARTTQGRDDLGREVFSIYVRYLRAGESRD